MSASTTSTQNEMTSQDDVEQPSEQTTLLANNTSCCTGTTCSSSSNTEMTTPSTTIVDECCSWQQQKKKLRKQRQLLPASLRKRFRDWFWEYSDWLEHAPFFLGTLCAFFAAKMDLQDAIAYKSYTDLVDNDKNAPSSFIRNPLLVWNWAKVLSVASTTFYLLDTLLEVECNPRALIPSPRAQCRQHPYNLPILFGLGALFDLGSSLFENQDNPWIGFVSEVLSVHFFLFSAAANLYSNICMQQPRQEPQQRQKTYYMTAGGDILFLVGALIDVAVSYDGDHPTVSEQEGRNEWIINASLGVVSSLTWMMDSILYLLADILLEQDKERSSYDYQEEDEDESSSETDGNSTTSCDEHTSSSTGEDQTVDCTIFRDSNNTIT